MNEIDKLRLMVELTNEYCELNHGPDTRREDFPASDYIVMPFGYEENEVTDIAIRELVVPVCYGCATALLGNEWTLIYCFECCCSQWVNRKLAKNNYRDHLLWLRGCPQCTNEFGGLYFNDFKAVADSAMFLTRQLENMAA